MIRDNDYLWFKLLNVNGIGPKTFHKIYDAIKKYSISLSDFYKMDFSEFELKFNLRSKIFKALHELNDEECFQLYENLKRNSGSFISFDHSTYPAKMRETLGSSAPPLLFYKGNLSLLNTNGIAIVGSRNVSDYVSTIAQNIASKISNNGMNVISGYASGIDTNAHLGALQSDGTTTIVLSYGILEFTRKKIFSHIHWDGNVLVLSQFLPKEKWTAQKAMIRNRLTVALSDGVIVIASGLEKDNMGKMSGTYNSAKTAFSLQIPVFVISPTLVKSHRTGNSELIRQGGIEVNEENIIKKINSTIARQKHLGQRQFDFE